MARFFYIIFPFISLACSGPVAEHVPPAREIMLNVVSPSLDIERNSYRASYIIPGRYNIELVEWDTLHPVMRITYSARMRAGDDYEWVNAVLNLDINSEQRSLLRSLLRGDLRPLP